MENIVQRKNRDNQTYIDCAMGLLYYFQLGGFHIREDKRYGYLVYIEKKDRNVLLDMISHQNAKTLYYHK